MKRSLALSVATLLMLSAAAFATPPSPQLENDTLSPSQSTTALSPSTTKSVATWGMNVTEVPNILRMHCAVLEGNVGVLVVHVSSDGLADRAGLQNGDVVLEVNGSRIHDVADLPDRASRPQVLVLRRGHVQASNQSGFGRTAGPFRFGQQTLPSNPGDPNHPGDHVQRMVEQMIRQSGIRPGDAVPPAWMSPGRIGPAARSGVYASSSAGGNESMSVSRAGDQISIEMSSPDGGPAIRLQGTMAQIEQQMRAQRLSPVAEQKVRQALGQ